MRFVSFLKIIYSVRTYGTFPACCFLLRTFIVFDT